MKKLVTLVVVAAIALCLSACALLKSEAPGVAQDYSKCALVELEKGTPLDTAAELCGVKTAEKEAFKLLFGSMQAAHAAGVKAGAKVGSAGCGDAGAPPAPAKDAGATSSAQPPLKDGANVILLPREYVDLDDGRRMAFCETTTYGPMWTY